MIHATDAPPFVVFSLPRSRSTWLSLFLSYGGRTIGHDIGPDCSGPGDFFVRLGAGACETGAAFAWRQIRTALPSVRFAVVLRDPHEVAASLERFGLTGYLPEMQKRDDDLHDIADLPGTLAVDYAELSKSTICAEIFEHCLGEEMPLDWWRRFDPINIQVDMAKQVAKLAANHDAIEVLKADVRRRA